MCRKTEKFPQKPEPTSALDLTENKFEAVKYRHEDQAKLLQKMSEIDLKIVMSFITLQLALGSFITQINLSCYGKVGLCILDVSLFCVCIYLLSHNNKRRKEATSTITNCNIALGYKEPNLYITDNALNPETKPRRWFNGYLVGLILSVIGIFVVVKTNHNTNETNKNQNIKIMIANPNGIDTNKTYSIEFVLKENINSSDSLKTNISK